MIYLALSDFLKHFICNQRILAIDYGTKKTGIASTDRSLCLCTPYKTIITKSKNQLYLDLDKIITELTPWGIILGYPLLKDGNESKFCENIKIIAQELTDHFSLPILLFNEIGTSHKAQQILMDLNIKRKRRDMIDDQLAANLLLESVIDIIKKHIST